MKIIYNNEVSNEFYLRSWVLQEALLYPILYMIFINDICEDLIKININFIETVKFYNNSFKLLIFLFVDDICLFAKNKND